MFVQGRLQNRVGFDGNPLGSDAKPEAKPEGGVEPEREVKRITERGNGGIAHQRARESGKSGPDHVAGA